MRSLQKMQRCNSSWLTARCNLSLSPWQRSRARQALATGEVIAYPTEAVYGLGCDPFNPDAVERLLQLKRRPMHKGLILLAADIEMIEPLLQHLPEPVQAEVCASWPGAVTWLLPDPDDLVPRWVKGKHSSVAVRVTAHPLAHQLCELAGGLLVSTSANVATARPALSPLDVRLYFHQGVELISGPLGGLAKPTPIRDPMSGHLLRS